MNKTNKRTEGRTYRRKRIRKVLQGTGNRPRLSVFKSAKHIYVQVIDDVLGKTLVSASTRDQEFKGDSIKGNVSGAKQVGFLIAKRAKTAGITQIVFDRGGYRFHGQLKALADAAREAGLKL